MTEEKIRNIIELFIAWNGETEAIDVANLDSAVDFIAYSLQEKTTSEDLEKAARKYAGIPEDSPHDLKYCVQDKKAKYDAVLFGANWQKENQTNIEYINKDSLIKWLLMLASKTEDAQSKVFFLNFIEQLKEF